MPPKYFKTNGHLLVCQGVNCRARGADLLHAALTNGLEQHKLAYYKTGGSLRLTAAGCLGACGYGPVLACYRERNGELEEAWYAAVSFPLALKVARAAHDREDFPPEHRYGPS